MQNCSHSIFQFSFLKVGIKQYILKLVEHHHHRFPNYSIKSIYYYLLMFIISILNYFILSTFQKPHFLKYFLYSTIMFCTLNF